MHTVVVGGLKSDHLRYREDYDTGCLEKSEFNRIEHLQNGFPSCYEQLDIFGCFLLRPSRIKRTLIMSMGKYGPTAPIFGYDLSVPLWRPFSAPKS